MVIAWDNMKMNIFLIIFVHKNFTDNKGDPNLHLLTKIWVKVSIDIVMAHQNLVFELAIAMPEFAGP
jgi:hypothetical protein